MRTSVLDTVRRRARRLVDLFTPRAIILLYHRVADLPADPQLLSVTPKNFAEHLAVIRGCGSAVQINGLGGLLDSRMKAQRGVVVTFDDGYADNLHHAKPILERNDVPATIFVTSGYIGSSREFWYDELERLLLCAHSLPATLRLAIRGQTYEWEIAGPEDETASAWDVTREEDPTPRHRLYRTLCEMLQPLPDDERREVLDGLAAWADADVRGRQSHRTLSAEELIRLADGGLVEIGAHTVSHPTLSALAPAAQAEEIRQSKSQLESMIGQPVTSFAYPFGRPCDYTADSVAAVRQSGFDFACSNFPGLVRPRTDRWQLPRFLVRDWDGDEFARKLESWIHA